MAGFPVAGDQYWNIDRKILEIKRQLNQKGGCPSDPEKIERALQDIIEGNFGAIPAEPRRIIDCDATPFIPDGWNVEEHRRGGEIEFDPTKVALHLDDGQKNGRTIVGSELRKRLAGKPLLNACVLDFLLANPAMIPESWKDQYVFFWGTIYRDSGGGLYVRCLYWRVGRWRWDCSWLGCTFGDRCPAAVSAS